MFSLFSCLLLVVSLKVLPVESSLTMSLRDERGNKVNVKVEPVGCYGDTDSPRALRKMYFNARGFYAPDGSKTDDVIKACAENAYKKGYKVVFGIQYYGECWSDDEAEARFSKYGVTSNCEHGVGKGWANMIYHLTVIPKSPPKNCIINGKEYSDGAKMRIPDDWSINVYDSKCMRCVCSGGEAKDCKTLYYCDVGLKGALCSRWRNATGRCCPVCDCFNNGKAMGIGSTWLVRKWGRCSECTCHADNTAHCTASTRHQKCPDGHHAISVPGKCADKCVPKPQAIPTYPPPETLPPPPDYRPPPTFPPPPMRPPRD